MPPESVLLIDRQPEFWRLTLNRPDKRNALNPELIALLKVALMEAAAAPDRPILILTGAGKAFSAGADLETLQSICRRTPEENRADSDHLRELFLAMINHPAPMIAAVNGPALAGGCGLTTACDHVIAAPNASFGYPEVKIGFVAAIVAPLLVRGIGERRARELLLSGRTIAAEEARSLGLIHEIVPAEELRARAEELAQNYRKNSPTAIALTKRELAEIAGLSLHDALNYGATLNAEVRATPDLHEGVAAFLEKRLPIWPSRAGKKI